MSVRFGNEETFVGAVLKTYDHMWADGMLDVWQRKQSMKGETNYGKEE